MVKLWIKITYTVDKDHPDYAYMHNEEPRKTIHEYTDIYTFNTLDPTKGDKEYALAYAKRDMKLVAGGGYNWKHIHNTRFHYKFL